MPISRDEYNQGKDLLDVYFFLKSHRKKAYTFEEVQTTLGLESVLAEQFVLYRQLHSLLNRADVEARIVNGRVYYAFTGDR